MYKVKHFWRLAVIEVLLPLVFLAGCGTRSEGPSLPQMTRAELLRNFVLLDQDGQELAARSPKGTAPFAVILKAPEGGEWGQCSATQIAPGVVLTGFHCATGPVDDLFLIYYSSVTGRREISPVTRVLYGGNSDYDDLSLLEVPAKVRTELDVVSDRVSLRGFKKNEVVLLSAFDPLSTRPEYASLYPAGTAGAVFSTRRCLGQQRIPQLGKLSRTGNIVDISPFNPKNKVLDPQIHVFLDSCVNTQRFAPSSTVLGDSGGLISDESFQSVAGSFAWLLMKKDFAADEVYLGNANRWLNVQADIPGGSQSSVLNTGTLLAPIVERNSQLKSLFK